MISEEIKKRHPFPWSVKMTQVKATKTCHHASVAWDIVDANGRKVWRTMAVTEAIVETMNQEAK